MENGMENFTENLGQQNMRLFESYDSKQAFILCRVN